MADVRWVDSTLGFAEDTGNPYQIPGRWVNSRGETVNPGIAEPRALSEMSEQAFYDNYIRGGNNTGRSFYFPISGGTVQYDINADNTYQRHTDQDYSGSNNSYGGAGFLSPIMNSVRDAFESTSDVVGAAMPQIIQAIPTVVATAYGGPLAGAAAQGMTSLTSGDSIGQAATEAALTGGLAYAGGLLGGTTPIDGGGIESGYGFEGQVGGLTENQIANQAAQALTSSSGWGSSVPGYNPIQVDQSLAPSGLMSEAAATSFDPGLAANIAPIEQSILGQYSNQGVTVPELGAGYQSGLMQTVDPVLQNYSNTIDPLDTSNTFQVDPNLALDSSQGPFQALENITSASEPSSLNPFKDIGKEILKKALASGSSAGKYNPYKWSGVNLSPIESSNFAGLKNWSDSGTGLLNNSTQQYASSDSGSGTGLSPYELLAKMDGDTLKKYISKSGLFNLGLGNYA